MKKVVPSCIEAFYEHYPHSFYFLAFLIIIVGLFLISAFQHNLYKSQAGWNHPHRLTDSRFKQHYEISDTAFHKRTINEALDEIGIKNQLSDGLKINLGGSAHFENGKTENAFKIGSIYMSKYDDVEIVSPVVSNIKKINPEFSLDAIVNKIDGFEYYVYENGQQVINGDKKPLNPQTHETLLQLMLIGQQVAITDVDINTKKIAVESAAYIYFTFGVMEDLLLEAGIYNDTSLADKKTIRRNFLYMIPNSNSPVSFKWLSEAIGDSYSDFYKIVKTHKYRDLFYARSINAFLNTASFADFSKQKHALSWSDFSFNLIPILASDDIKPVSFTSRSVRILVWLCFLLLTTLFYKYVKFVFKS